MPQDFFLTQVIERAAECKNIDFSQEREQFEKGLGPEPRLQADQLRRLILGRQDQGHWPDFDPAQVHRWEIAGATVVGRLDLRDGRLPSGSPLPALEFQDCTFEGGIVADGVHLERLHLSQCRLGNIAGEPSAELSLRNARVENEVRLRELYPFFLAPGTILRVDANAMNVGGNFVLKKSTLRAPLDCDEQDPLRIPYALNLRNADIGADLLLQPDLTLHGGVLAIGAHIRGDVRCEGLIADDGYNPEFRAALRKSGSRRRSSLCLSSADVGGNLWLLSSPLGRPSVLHGEVDMYGIQIDGGLQVWGVTINPCFGETDVDRDMLAMNFAMAHIKGYVRFDSVACRASSERSDSTALPIGDPESVPTRIRGLLNLAGATVKGDLALTGEYDYLTADDLHLEGTFNLNAQVVFILSMKRARIGGDCDLTAFRFYSADPWSSPKFRPQLFMQDADIKRTLRLNEWSEQSGEDALRFVAARECSPRCYPRLRIVVVKAEQKDPATPDSSREFWAPFIAFPGIVGDVLTRSEPLHTINARGYLHLVDDEDYRDYLRLFCAYVWGEEGAFAIIEPEPDGRQPYAQQQVEEGTMPRFEMIDISRAAKRAPNHQDQRTKTPQDAKLPDVRALAYVRYAGIIFAAEFGIWRTGEIEMMQDKPLCKLKEGVSPTYDLQRRTRSGTDDSDYRLMCLYGRDHEDPAWLDAMIPDWRRTVLKKSASLAGALVFLTDATCGTLQDANGSAWGSSVGLALENFTYDRIAEDPYATRALWPWMAFTELPRRILAARQSLHLRSTPSFRLLGKWLGLPPFEIPTLQQELDIHNPRWFHNLRQSGLRRTGVRDRLRWLEQRMESRETPRALAGRFPIQKITSPFLERIKKRKGISAQRAEAEFPEPFLHQPYVQLAKVLREQGNDADAKDVEEQRIRIESWLRAKRGPLGVVALLLWWIPYGFFFRYGLSPARAITTFVGCIVIGCAGVHYANAHHILMQSTSTAATSLRSGPDGPEAYIPYGRNPGQGDLECGSSINDVVYAVDAFIPLLNLHQEERCHIRSASNQDQTPVQAYRQPHKGLLPRIRAFFASLMLWPSAWQFFGFIYAVGGRVISSLMLLTVSGALRKWENK